MQDAEPGSLNPLVQMAHVSKDVITDAEEDGEPTDDALAANGCGSGAGPQTRAVSKVSG